MGNEWVLKKGTSSDRLKSLTCFEDTHLLLIELKEQTGLSMAEIMRSALNYAVANLRIEDE